MLKGKLVFGGQHAAAVWGIDADVFAGFGQWAGAVASFVAVAVALGIAIRDGRRRDRERRDSEKAQARTVTGAVKALPFESSPGMIVSHSAHQVAIENHGHMPILDVVVHEIAVEIDGNRLTKWRAASEDVDLSNYRLAAVIGPGGVTGGPGALVTFSTGSRLLDLAHHDVEVSFSFTDAAGLRWRRARNGDPERILT